MVVVLNAALSGHDKRAIYYDSLGDCFYMNAEVFFDRVKNTIDPFASAETNPFDHSHNGVGRILEDFATYLGSLSPAYRLPTIVSPSTLVSGVVPTITGLVL
jgi:hypothetical protein